MTDSYLEHQLVLLDYVQQLLRAWAREDLVPEEHEQFLQRLADLRADLGHNPDARYQGQDIISQIFQRYPQVAHRIPRDLLWFFAGECLHYLADEEIAQYQQLEERRFQALERGELFDWNTEVQLAFMPAAKTAH